MITDGENNDENAPGNDGLKPSFMRFFNFWKYYEEHEMTEYIEKENIP